MRVLSISVPLDLRRTVGLLQVGAYDPTTQVGDRELWRATRTPSGAGTLHVRRTAEGVEAQAWGPGADWMLDHLADLLGLHDDPGALVTDHALVGDLLRRLPGLRIGRSFGVLHALWPAVLGQRVTGQESTRQWRALCRALPEAAPGPTSLLLPPDPDRIAGQPYWWFHRFGIERNRADTLRRAAQHAARLSEAATMTLPEAWRRLQAVRGIGPWTAAEIVMPALGDPDAVSVGDFHLPNMVAWALAGEARADDARMLELLSPFAGQRGRVVRLLLAGGPSPPKFGPRHAIPDNANR